MYSLTSGGKAYQLRKAQKKPSQLKKNTRPYLSKGLKTGIDLALRFKGFTSGAEYNDLKNDRAMIQS